MKSSYLLYCMDSGATLVGAAQRRLSGRKILPGLLLGLLMTLLLTNQNAWAQGRTVTGRVTDPAGSGLPGVSVQVKGTTRGTNTDADGKYSLTNVPDNATLVLSFIGFTPQEQIVGNKSVLDATMAEDQKALDEVVVIGYGTAKRKDLTGSVTQVSAKDFNSGVNTNPLQAIQGKVAGLVITTPSGDPNAAQIVRLRGYTSLSGSGDPLYVVDGVIGVPINTVAPTDIENIDVLKDASASAIYGSRAANGVVIITTKRGKSGKTTVTFNNFVGVQSISRRLDMLDGPGYRNAVRTLQGDAALLDKRKFPDGDFNTDWVKEITRDAYIKNTDLAVSGGSPAFSYRGSINYIDNQGIVKNTGFDRVTARINLDQKALDNRLTIQYNLSYAETNQKGDPDIDRRLIGAATTFLPTLPVRNANGQYAEILGSQELQNPVSLLENYTYNKRKGYLQGGVNMRYEVIDGLSLGVNGQLQRENTVDNGFLNPASLGFASSRGFSVRGLEQKASKLLELTTTYARDLAGSDNNFSLLGGYSFQQFDNDGFRASNSGFVTPDLNFNSLQTGSDIVVNPSNRSVGSYRNQSKLISFFGRATLNLGDRYNVTASLRRDGSTKFGANNKWGMFPSAAAGWTISNMPFFPKSNVLSYLKLRVGYGATGNQENIGAYNSIQLYGPDGTYYDGKIDNFLSGYGITQNNNPNLKWEVITTSNVGLDFQLFSSRFSGTLEYYDKRAKDMLYNFQVPVDGETFFTDNILANVGEMRNWGIELSFGGDVVQKKDFNWNSRIVASYNNNKILNASSAQFNAGDVRFNPFGGRGLSAVNSSILTVGRPYGEFNYVPTFAGYDSKGLVLFKPGKGDIPVTDYTLSDAEVARVSGNPIAQGNPQPFLNASFINTFNYKNFDLNFMFRGVFGNSILNNLRSNLMIPGSILETNQLRDVTTMPANYGKNALSTFWLESGTFVRLDNAQIGYNIPIPAGKYLSNARVYLGGNNLLLFTAYKGIDPELDVAAKINGRQPSDIGLDKNGIYPRSRTFQLGVNLTF